MQPSNQKVQTNRDLTLGERGWREFCRVMFSTTPQNPVRTVEVKQSEFADEDNESVNSRKSNDESGQKSDQETANVGDEETQSRSSGEADNTDEGEQTNGDESGDDEVEKVLRSLVPRVELDEPDLPPHEMKQLGLAVEKLYQHCVAKSGSKVLASPQNLLGSNVTPDTLKQNQQLQQELENYLVLFSASPSIVRVDNRFKDLFFNVIKREDARESKNIGFPIDLIDTVNYCNNIINIKLIALPNNLKGVFGKPLDYILHFSYSNGEKYHFLIKDDQQAIDLIFKIRNLIPSKQVETNRVAKRFRCEKKIPLRAKEYWNTWETKIQNSVHYVFINDPIVVAQFKQALKISPKKIITIIDIGAGTGRLAFRLLEAALEAGSKIHYKLLDDNVVSLEAAKELLEEAKESHPEVFASDPEYLVCDFSKPDAELDQRLKGTADVIICSGGPLSCLVGNYQPAKLAETKDTKIVKNLDIKLLRLKTYEAENCTVIVTGRTSPLVTAKDLRATEHQVLRTSVQAYTSEGMRVFFPCLVAVNKQASASASASASSSSAKTVSAVLPPRYKA